MPWLRSLCSVAALLVFAATATAQDQPSGVAADAARLDAAAAQVDDAARMVDWARARQSWSVFEDLWGDVEDGIRAVSRDAYRAIEQQMSAVAETLRSADPDIDTVRREIGGLRAHIQGVRGGSPVPASPRADGTPRPTPAPTPPLSFGAPQPAATLPPLAPTPRAGEPSPTPVPESCTTPSITLSPTSLRSDGVLDWRARGFKPGTTVRVVVQGPTSASSVSGPLVKRFESMPVDRSCSARANDEGIPAEGLLEDNANLPSGHYVLVVSGIRWTLPNVGESEMRLAAPFNFYYQSGFRP